MASLKSILTKIEKIAVEINTPPPKLTRLDNDTKGPFFSPFLTKEANEKIMRGIENNEQPK